MPKLHAQKGPAPLSIAEILCWADDHHRRTGEWPGIYSGFVADGPLGENWRKIDNALRYGLRGLPGKCSLAQLLAEHRGVRNHMGLPKLTTRLILKWADAFHERYGHWPIIESGPIPESPAKDTWKDIDVALRFGCCGLRPGQSLPQLLAESRGVRNLPGTPRLSVRAIVAWADDFRRRTGAWPRHNSGIVPAAPDETWFAIDAALRSGCRGLSGGSSLARLLKKYRGVGRATHGFSCVKAVSRVSRLLPAARQFLEPVS
jgi:hypothetical protein